MLKIGENAPSFSLPATDGTQIGLPDLAGKVIVLYFYPRDDTPGCTTQAIDFTDKLAEFAAENAIVLGVSKDKLSKHEKFANKHDLKVTLLSDENGTMCEDYGVWVEKSMYGKTFMGIERTTFLVGTDGTILNIWNKVRVKGHIQNVLEAVKSL